MASSLGLALGLLFVLEGLLPFLFPAQWRQTFERVSRLNDGQVRFFGLVALLFGMLILALTTLNAEA